MKSTPRLKEKYNKTIKNELKEELKISNIMAIPTLDKIVINSGLGEAKTDKTVIDDMVVYGSPCQPEYFAWEWNRKRGQEIAREWSKIPDDTQILIVHGVPYGILDLAPRGEGQYSHEGCEDLLTRIKQLKKLRLFVGAHIHRDNNEPPVIIDGVIYANASILNNKYEVVNDPIVIDL